jgi:Nup85 Nucleoporin
MSADQDSQKIVAMAWDPKNPAALVLPRAIPLPASQEGDRIHAMQINTMLSHTGVGANEHEIAALMQLLAAAEGYSQMKPATQRTWNARKTLSKAYRAALRECLCQWEEAQEKGVMADDTNEATNEENDNNIEMLKLVFAITHLSEIFLLAPPAEFTSSSLEYYEDVFVTPGALTAETVRYLRHHHVTPALQQLEPDIVLEIRESFHPDQIDQGKPYWFLLQALVKHGNLEQAWDLLTRHSLYRRANYAIPMDDNGNIRDNEYPTLPLQNARDGFEDLRRLLLSAPLPGGRDEEYDVGLDGPPTPRQEAKLLQGVPTNAYQLWETSQTTIEGNDFPINYNPSAANSTRQAWIEYVCDSENVKLLKRQIPQLETILKILRGDLSGVKFDNWAEALLCELIYKDPAIQPRWIQQRAEKLMEQYPRGHALDKCLLDIMKGSAGSLLSALYTFGGGSGAALPATMVRSTIE